MLSHSLKIYNYNLKLKFIAISLIFFIKFKKILILLEILMKLIPPPRFSNFFKFSRNFSQFPPKFSQIWFNFLLIFFKNFLHFLLKISLNFPIQISGQESQFSLQFPLQISKIVPANFHWQNNLNQQNPKAAVHIIQNRNSPSHEKTERKIYASIWTREKYKFASVLKKNKNHVKIERKTKIFIDNFFFFYSRKIFE